MRATLVDQILVHCSINSYNLCCILPSSASREGTLGDDSWSMTEVLAMFSLSYPASKLETVGKASPCLSSLERDAGSSAVGERALDRAIRIALIVNLLGVRVSVGA
nr:hypothetical protein [Tanacetum cinerariifolium]